MPRTRDGLSDMDWDKLKVFHAAAEAGSFTHAGEQLGLSQSAVSRQVSALEQELAVSLFHRHARGLILTEQGDLLFRTAHDVFMQLQAARAKLTDSRERPSGDLKVTTTPGVGINWLIPRLGEFTALYPDIRISLIVTDEELDLSMREADVAIRTRKPTQPDLIQRKLFSMGFHAYCSPEYVKRHGTLLLDELDRGSSCSATRTCRSTCRTGTGWWTPTATAQARAMPCSRSIIFWALCAPASRVSVLLHCQIIWSRITTVSCSCSARPTRFNWIRILSIPKN